MVCSALQTYSNTAVQTRLRVRQSREINLRHPTLPSHSQKNSAKSPPRNTEHGTRNTSIPTYILVLVQHICPPKAGNSMRVRATKAQEHTCPPAIKPPLHTKNRLSPCHVHLPNVQVVSPASPQQLVPRILQSAPVLASLQPQLVRHDSLKVYCSKDEL